MQELAADNGRQTELSKKNRPIDGPLGANRNSVEVEGVFSVDPNALELEGSPIYAVELSDKGKASGWEDVILKIQEVLEKIVTGQNEIKDEMKKNAKEGK